MSILSKKRKYTKVTVNQVIRLYNQGMNFSQIAEQLGCVRNTVRTKIKQYIQQTGKPVPTRTKPGLSFQDIKKVLTWYKNNKKVSDIAKYFHVTESCIYKILQKYRG